MKGTKNHRVKLDDDYVHLQDHPESTIVKEKMNVVDISVKDNENYFANGQLNHNTTSGGKSIQFHASVRLRLKPKGQIKDKDGRIVGMKVQCVVTKNRIGPPKRTMEFDIFFDRGIDNYGSWIRILKEYKIVKGTAHMTYVNEDTGEVHKFQSKTFNDLLEEHPELRKQLYSKICDAMVLEYQDVDTRDVSSLTVVDTDDHGTPKPSKSK